MAKICLTIDLRDPFFGGSPPGDTTALAAWRNRLRADVLGCLRFLSDRRLTATFFFTGQAAEELPELVPVTREGGHEVGILGLDDRRLDAIRVPEFRAQLARAKDLMERGGAEATLSYRAPHWSLTRRTLWSYEILGDLGFKFSSSSVPHTTSGDRRGLLEPHRVRTAAGEIVEIPLPTVRFFWENIPFSTGHALTRMPFWFLATCVRHRLEAGQSCVASIQSWELGPPRSVWHRLRARRLALNVEGIASLTQVSRLSELFVSEPAKLPIRLIEEQGRQRTFPVLDTIAEEAPIAASST